MQLPRNKPGQLGSTPALLTIKPQECRELLGMDGSLYWFLSGVKCPSSEGDGFQLAEIINY